MAFAVWHREFDKSIEIARPMHNVEIKGLPYWNNVVPLASPKNSMLYENFVDNCFSDLLNSTHLTHVR
ncbi:hypothetical protein L596_016011 [Steinernema carpocapsae]|uniref:Uncharacterized protein n=1 Tax=Steinernema carpocapsae TaxID=34508 RepID=A0A4V6XW93_STECR|nr:hypothetical protein L596_016011 [Steinernema carpocapsae]